MTDQKALRRLARDQAILLKLQASTLHCRDSGYLRLWSINNVR